MAEWIRQHELDNGGLCKHCGAVNPTDQATCNARPFREEAAPRPIPPSVVDDHDFIRQRLAEIVKEAGWPTAEEPAATFPYIHDIGADA